MARSRAGYYIGQIVRSLRGGIRDSGGVAQRRAGLLPALIEELGKSPLARHGGKLGERYRVGSRVRQTDHTHHADGRICACTSVAAERHKVQQPRGWLGGESNREMAARIGGRASQHYRACAVGGLSGR